MSFIFTTQGQIQDFFIGGTNLQRGFDLFILPAYLFIFEKIVNENEIIMKMKLFCLKGGFVRAHFGSVYATIEKMA